MKEIQKPNDIFVANLSAPEATTLDLLKNNINAENTSLLSPEEYKQTPFVKKKYSDDKGVFNEQAFNQDYLKAYNKYTELADAEAEDNLNKFLTWDKNDRYKPEGGKVWDTTPTFKKLRNPEAVAYSVTGINSKSDPVWTPEELAQSNFIYDPEKGTFRNETPESMPLYKKMFGETLVYAKWDEDGVHIDEETGEQVVHHKGEWKTDKNGNYYTEVLGNRELLDKQVVALGDILTDEGSLMNKVDFFDSDGYDKSGVGIFAKTVVPMLPYIAGMLIPGANYYAAMTTALGLASVLPTYYKAIESLFTGEKSSSLSKSATKAENWFKKWQGSKSYKGREGFFTWESAGELVSDVFAQLYQQRAAASAAKWFKKAPKKPAGFEGADIEALIKDPSKIKGGDVTSLVKYTNDLNDYIKGTSELGGKLNLAYMGLISAADVYNDALTSGYDRRTAGIAALASATALYKIMNFNETTRGIGNWMLDKTTGYSPELERGTLKKLAKDLMKEVEQDVKSIDKGIPKSKDAFRKFLSKMDDIFVIKGEDVWKRSLIEGVEEVSEEVVQDTIKGITDTLSYFGLTGKQGSFGGWDNVFSAEGAQRYLATFLGGAVGGGLFAAQNKLEQKFFTNTTAGKSIDYTIDDAIIDGRYQELMDLIPKCEKFFNQRQSASLGEIDGHQIHMSADNTNLSQAKVIAEQVKTRINTRMQAITRLTEGAKYNPNHILVYRELAKQYKDSGFDDLYVKKKWSNLVHEIADLQSSIDSMTTSSKEGEEVKPDAEVLKAKQAELKAKQQELHNWQNGVNLTNNTLAALVYLNKQISSNFLTLDIDSFAQDILGVDYKKAPETAVDGKLSKEDIRRKWEEYKQDITKDNIIESVDRTVDVIKKTMPSVANPIASFIKNESAKNWLLSSPFFNEDGELEAGALTPESYQDLRFANVIDYLNSNPKHWSLYEATQYDLAQALIDEKLIDLSDYNSEAQQVIKDLINNEAQSTGVTVWTSENLESLIDAVNKRIESNDASDIFINKLQEYYKEKATEGTESAAIDVVIPGIKTNDLSKASALTQKIRLKSILDVVEDLPFIDEDLYRMLDQTFSYERNVALAKVITEALDVNSFDDDGAYTFRNLFTSGFFSEPRILTLHNHDGSSVDINLQSTIDTKAWKNAESITRDIENFTAFVKELSSKFKKCLSDDVMYVDTTESVFSDSDYIQEAQNVLSNLINKINEFTIVPEELQTKWDIVKNKTKRQNPIYKILKDLCHKFGVDNNNLIDYLWEKEDQARSNTTQNYELSAADKQSLLDIKNVINFTRSIIACMSDSDPRWGEGLEDFMTLMPAGVRNNITSFNGVVRNAIITGNDIYNKLEDFPIFDRKDLANVETILNNIENRADALAGLSLEQEKRSNANDIQTRSKYNVNLCLKLSQLHLELPDGSELKVTEKPYDLDDLPENIELANEQILCELGNQVNSWINKQGGTKEAIRSVLEKLSESFPLAYEQEQSITEGLVSEDADEEAHISQTLLWRSIVRAIAADPKKVNELYLQGFEGSDLIPRFDQEFAIKEIIAKNLNPEIYAVTTEIEQKLLEAAEETDKTLNSKRILCENISFVRGGGGAGKTTIMQLILKALKPENVLFLAPTQDKVDDLLKIDYDKKQGKTIQDFFGDKINNVLKEINSKLADKLNSKEIQDNAFESIDPYEFSIKVEIDGSETEIFFNLTHGEVKENVQNILLADKSKEILNKLITSDLVDTVKNTAIFIDEATNLGMFEQVLLNEIANLGDNVTIQEFGDSAQLSKTLDLKGVKTISIPFGLIDIFTHSIPPLSGNLRLKNSGRSKNLTNITNVVTPYTKVLHSIDLTGEEFKDVQEQFESMPLIYNGAMGDQIVTTSADAITKLKELSKAINGKTKSFKVIYETESQIEAIKSELKAAGLNDAIVDDASTYKSLQNIQGAEADYIYVYNLSTNLNPSAPYWDTDVDLQRIYTALSRSKDFTLIQSSNPNDLFISYELTSIEDAGVSEFAKGSYTDQNKNRTDQLKEIISKLPDRIEIKEPSKPDDDETSESYSEADVEDDSASSTTITPGVEAPIAVGEESVLDSTVESEGSSEPEPEFIDTPKIDESSKPADDSLTFKDAIEIYGYYIRLGITSDEAKKLSELSKDGVASFLQEKFDAATPIEQHKDLLGFWKYSGVKYTNGQELLTKFVEARNKLLYKDATGNLYIDLKRKNNTDFAYLKPNDKTFADTREGQVISSLVAEAGTGENAYYVSIARIGYNAKEDGKIWSDTYFKLLNEYKDSTSSDSDFQTLHKLKWNGKKAEREDYIKSRSSKLNGILRKELIAISGLRDFKIDKTIERNKDIITSDNLKFSRMSVAELKKLGYNVEILPGFTTIDEFKAAFDKYRIEAISDKTWESISYLYKNMWAKITPIGIKATEDQTKIVMLQTVRKNTIWDAFNINTNHYYLGKKRHLKPTAIKSILSYIAYIGGYKGDALKGLNPRLIQGSKTAGFSQNTKRIKQWDNALEQFINDFDNNSLWSNPDKVKGLKTSLQKFTSDNILNGTQYKYNFSSLSSGPLESFLKSTESQNYLYDINLPASATKDMVDGCIVTRVFEGPKGYLDFNEFTVEKFDFGRPAEAKEEVVTSVEEEITETPVETAPVDEVGMKVDEFIKDLNESEDIEKGNKIREFFEKNAMSKNEFGVDMIDSLKLSNLIPYLEANKDVLQKMNFNKHFTKIYGSLHMTMTAAGKIMNIFKC